MAKCLIGYTNQVETGVVRAESEVADRPASNLQSPNGGAIWQTSGTTSSWFEVDAGAAANWRALGLFRTNLTSSATVRWMLGSTAGGVEIFDSGVMAAGVVAGFGQTVTVLASDMAARYLRCEISDSTNPDSNIQVGLAYAGPVWEPSLNFQYGGTPAPYREDGNNVTRTKGGQDYVTVGWLKRLEEFPFRYLTAGEAHQEILDLDLVSRLGGNALVIPNPDSADLQRAAIYGRAKCGKAPASAYQRNDWNLSIEERL